DVRIGATIFCLSHPSLDCDGSENAFWTFTSGMVSGKLRLRLDSRQPIDALAITADYAQGSSGGPILNEQGAVVGMVCHTMSLCADGDHGSMQMTWKMTRPSSSILALLQGEPPATATTLSR
ncbi:MAG: serine protease, partial [Patescibacteria group bacterium]|nr:serine protease [Patescibacteria group bacterium]